MSSKWSVFAVHVGIVALSAFVGSTAEIAATGVFGPWTPVATVGLSVVGSALHAMTQKQPPAV